MKKILILLIALSLSLNFMFITYALSTNVFDDLYLSIDEQLYDAQVNGISEDNNPNSPYSLIDNNKYFDKITSKGIKFLPDIYNEVQEQENSMYAYVLALAIEEIINVDFKKNNHNWDSSISFQSVFNKHIDTIERKTNEILTSNLTIDEKQNKLKQIGELSFAFINFQTTLNAKEYKNYKIKESRFII